MRLTGKSSTEHSISENYNRKARQKRREAVFKRNIRFYDASQFC